MGHRAATHFAFSHINPPVYSACIEFWEAGPCSISFQMSAAHCLVQLSQVPRPISCQSGNQTRYKWASWQDMDPTQYAHTGQY